MKQLTSMEKAQLGAKWGEVLNLRKDKVNKRWLTNWGDKTDLGLYEVINRLVYSRHD